MTPQNKKVLPPTRSFVQYEYLFSFRFEMLDSTRAGPLRPARDLFTPHWSSTEIETTECQFRWLWLPVPVQTQELNLLFDLVLYQTTYFTLA